MNPMRAFPHPLPVLVLLSLAVPSAHAQGPISQACEVAVFACQTTTEIWFEPPDDVPRFPAERIAQGHVRYTYEGPAAYTASGETAITVELADAPASVRIEPLQWVIFVPIRFSTAPVSDEQTFPLHLACVDSDRSGNFTMAAEAEPNGGLLGSSSRATAPVTCGPAADATPAAPTERAGPSGASLPAAGSLSFAVLGSGIAALAWVRRSRRP